VGLLFPLFIGYW